MIKQLLIAYLIPVAVLSLRISAGAAESFDWVVEPRFESAGIFSEGMADVKSGGRYGYINSRGEMVIEPRFDEAGDFTDGFAVVSVNNTPVYVNRKGVQTIVLKKDERRYFGEDLAVIKIYGKYGYIRSNGEMALKPVYEDALSFSEGYAPVRINGRYGFINKRGKVILKPVYDKASIFSEGVAAVRINGKWSYINRKGRIAVKAVYDEAGDYNGGYAPVKNDSGFGYIDRRGKFVVEPQFEEALSFSEKKAAVKLNGRWGYIKLKSGGIKKSEGKTSHINSSGERSREIGKTVDNRAEKNENRGLYEKTPVNVRSEGTGKTIYKPSEKMSSDISVKRSVNKRSDVSEQVNGDSYPGRGSLNLSGESSRQTEQLKKPDSTSGISGDGTVENKGEKENEYIPAFNYNDEGNDVKENRDIPVIKGMKYVGILNEVNAGQVIVTDSKTGRKMYLGAWCIIKVEDDRVYIEAGTPFSAIAKCDFRNGFYEKIKPGMKVYKKIK